jgi:hypothetical protein
VPTTEVAASRCATTIVPARRACAPGLGGGGREWSTRAILAAPVSIVAGHTTQVTVATGFS